MIVPMYYYVVPGNKFLWLGNFAWDFLGIKFWSRKFWGGFVLSPRDFGGF